MGQGAWGRLGGVVSHPRAEETGDRGGGGSRWPGIRGARGGALDSLARRRQFSRVIEQLPEVQKLSPREKRALAIELWSEAEFEPAEVDPEVVALLNDRWESYERGEMPARSWDRIRSEIRRS